MPYIKFIIAGFWVLHRNCAPSKELVYGNNNIIMVMFLLILFTVQFFLIEYMLIDYRCSVPH